LKIWFDVLTPKQTLFFESMAGRLGKRHTVLCTSRNYREASGLAKVRRFKADVIGRHGGGSVSSKLDAGIERMGLLSPKIRRFGPDLTISFCSPDAARVSFGLGIPHIGFSNAPHSVAVMRLSVPLLTKLLIPRHIPKSEFAKYGIGSRDIISYNAMDEFLIIKNKTVPSRLPRMRLGRQKTVLFRTYEAQASYIPRHTDIAGIIDGLLKGLPDCNLVVLGRYDDEIRALKKRYAGRNLTVLDRVVDSRAILAVTDLFVGSGGTMTTEAVLRKIPSISYQAAPHPDEEYLVGKRLLIRAKTPDRIVGEAARLLQGTNADLKKRAARFVSGMTDPYQALKSAMRLVKST